MYLKAVPSRLVRLADENAGKLYGIGEEILIENAASALYDECPKVKSAVILAGPGNNGRTGSPWREGFFSRAVTPKS